jgi:hypothetical protein
MTDPYATEAESAALIQKDTRTAAQKRLDWLLEVNGAWEEGAEAYPVLYQIALELLEKRK